MDGVGAANGFGAGFGEAEVLYLALLDKVFDRARDVFDGDFGVDAMLIEQVDGFDAKALEGAFDALLDPHRAAVEAGRGTAVGVEAEAEFGGDDDLIAQRAEALADDFFIHEWAVDLGGVEEGDAPVDCSA